MRLVERESVQVELAEHAAAAAAGSGRVVLVRGEAGIGKSSVVADCARRVDAGTRVSWGGCDPLTTPAPLGPVLEALGQVNPTLVDELAGAAGGAPAAVLATLRDGGPTVWVVEDAHWADGATLDVLRYVGRRIASMPVLLVITYRDNEVGLSDPLMALVGDLARSAPLYRIELAPLSRDGVRALAEGRGFDVLEVDNLHATTAGNPFFVTEALASGSGSAVPPRVAEAVLGGLARLSPGAREVVDIVAILGPDATPAMVGAMSPAGERGLVECIAAGALREDGLRVGFRHELARAAVLESMPAHRRRDLHASAMTSLAIGHPAEQTLPHLAFHAEQAGDTNAVLSYAPAAAAEAARLGAHREAVDHYALALRYADDVDTAQRADWWEGRAYAAYLCGLGEDAAASMTEAIAVRSALGDTLREGDGLRWLSHVMYPAGPVSEVAGAARRAVALLEPLGPTTELAWAYAALALTSIVTYDRATTVKYVQKAVDLAVELGDQAISIRSEMCRAMAEITASGAGWEWFDTAWPVAVADPAAAEQAGFAGVAAAWLVTHHHELTRAERYLDQATRFCRDHNLMGFELSIDGCATHIQLDRGHFAAAETTALRMLDQPGPSPLHRLWPLVAAALARARTGRADVWPLLDEALDCHDHADLFRTGMVWAARIETAWLGGDHARALTEADRALGLLTADTDRWITGRIARWARIAGADVGAWEAAAAGPYADELEGDHDAAAREWEARGCHYQAAIARLCSRTPNVAESAVAALESLGAQGAAERARETLRAGRRYTRTRTDPHGLTEREREVAELLAKRYTNREIAEELVISTRTVEHHVASVLAKLGGTTRAEVSSLLS